MTGGWYMDAGQPETLIISLRYGLWNRPSSSLVINVLKT